MFYGDLKSKQFEPKDLKRIAKKHKLLKEYDVKPERPSKDEPKTHKLLKTPDAKPKDEPFKFSEDRLRRMVTKALRATLIGLVEEALSITDQVDQDIKNVLSQLKKMPLVDEEVFPLLLYQLTSKLSALPRIDKGTPQHFHNQSSIFYVRCLYVLTNLTLFFYKDYPVKMLISLLFLYMECML